MDETTTVITINNSEWTSINLLKYRFKTSQLKEVVDHLKKNFDPEAPALSDLCDCVDNFFFMHDGNIYLDNKNWRLAHLRKADLADFIFYVMWTTYSSKHQDIDREAFQKLVEEDQTVRKILSEKGFNDYEEIANN